LVKKKKGHSNIVSMTPVTVAVRVPQKNICMFLISLIFLICINRISLEKLFNSC